MRSFSFLLILLLISSLSGCLGESAVEERTPESQIERLQVIDITEGKNSSSPGVGCYNSEFCTSYTFYEYGNSLYFSTYPQVNIYSMDTHTISVADDMVASIACSWCKNTEKPMQPIYFEDRAYFIGNDYNIWMNDFSTSKSTLIYDLNALGDSFRQSSGNSKNPAKYLSLIVGETWFFSSDSAEFGLELWSMNLTNHEVALVVDTAPGTFVHGQNQQEYPKDGNPGKHFSMVLGDKLYFSAFNETEHSLWIHDTSNSSTWQIPDVSFSGPTASLKSIEKEPRVVGDVIYFSDMDNILAYNTTNHDLRVVVDELENIGFSFFEYVDGTLFFDARPELTLEDRKLWAHNLSNSTSWLINDRGSFPSSMSGWYGNAIYFRAQSAEFGSELWAFDSGNMTSWMVSDINPGTGSSSPQFLGVGNEDIFYFSADEQIHGRELWVHSTKNGTSWLFADINPGSEGSNPGGINSNTPSVETQNILFFPAYNEEFGIELWRLIL